MRKTKNKRLRIISGLLIFIALALNINCSFAAIIRDENGNPVPWGDIKAKDATRTWKKTMNGEDELILGGVKPTIPMTG